MKATVLECIPRLAQINWDKHCLDKNMLLTVIHALVFSQMYCLLFECLGKYHK